VGRLQQKCVDAKLVRTTFLIRLPVLPQLAPTDTFVFSDANCRINDVPALNSSALGEPMYAWHHVVLVWDTSEVYGDVR
jgi:hypothetical protein